MVVVAAHYHHHHHTYYICIICNTEMLLVVYRNAVCTYDANVYDVASADLARRLLLAAFSPNQLALHHIHLYHMYIPHFCTTCSTYHICIMQLVVVLARGPPAASRCA